MLELYGRREGESGSFQSNKHLVVLVHDDVAHGFVGYKHAPKTSFLFINNKYYEYDKKIFYGKDSFLFTNDLVPVEGVDHLDTLVRTFVSPIDIAKLRVIHQNTPAQNRIKIFDK